MAEPASLRSRALARPPVRVNQLGYAADGPKVATWITETNELFVFVVQDRHGGVVFRGRAEPAGHDKTSGFGLQLLCGPASKIYPGFPGDPRFDGLPPQLWYVDEPTSETTNDVCIRWNASLVWLAGYLADS
jgi:hypothetical protein